MDNNLFELIKNHKYDKIKEIINMETNIDLNITDKSGIYLIEYIIMYNNIDLLALSLTKNIKLDILTNDGYTLLYYPIKYNYIEIVKLLLYFNNINIGISLLDLIDINNRNSIFYAIEFNNIDIINLILTYNFNYNIKDKDGNTCLHYAFKNKNQEIIKLLVEKNMNINVKNNIGITSIIYAVSYDMIDIVKILLKNNININIKDDINQMTPFLISVYNNNVDIVKLLMEKEIDYNEQDIQGNTVLFYTIMNKNSELYDILINRVNLQLINIEGQNILNYLLNSDIPKKDYSKYYISKLLSQCNLNNQDNLGNTNWHKIIELDLWKDYYDIFTKTKNKIFILNHNNITPYDILLSKKYNNKILDDFLEMITESYYYNLKKNYDTTIKYINKWDNECITSKFNYDKCKKIIKNNIIKNKLSYPLVNRGYCIELNINNINFVSYTGLTIDVFFGLIYLKQKYNYICTSLNDDFTINETLIQYYNNLGVYKNPKYDFLNFEILWIYQKLFIPSTLNNIIKNFKKNDKLKYLIIPIGIELSKGGHANILFYSKKTNELERFEPYGRDYPSNFNYIPNLLDQKIKEYFSSYFENLIYLTPTNYQQKIGPQLLDTNELKKEKKIGDPSGYCAAWSLWYADIRLKYNNIKREVLIHKIINKYRLNNIAIRSVIRNYVKDITDLRDNYLSKVNIDINNWINFNITDDQFNKLINIIKIDIKKLLC